MTNLQTMAFICQINAMMCHQIQPINENECALFDDYKIIKNMVIVDEVYNYTCKPTRDHMYKSFKESFHKQFLILYKQFKIVKDDYTPYAPNLHHAHINDIPCMEHIIQLYAEKSYAFMSLKGLDN